MSTTFRALPPNARPIHWQDKGGVTHSCEAADVHPGVRLIWTDCRRDVPANQAYLPGDKDGYPDCERCRAAQKSEESGR